MAISPVGDIVMDVLKAADPATAEAARARLAAGAPSGGETFSVNEAASAAPRVEANGDKKPLQKFEAMVLQNFIEAMLPKSDDAAFGGGMAGDMWKGLMAEKVAGVVAERGGIGIADRLLADHYKADGKTVPIGPAASAPSQAGAGQAMLSSALVEEMQRKALGALTGTMPNG